MNGCLDVLSVGKGHLSFSFDKADEAEVEKARRVIEDMLGRGYTVLVEHEGGLKKVKKFDRKTDSYVIEEPAPRTVPLRLATKDGKTCLNCGQPIPRGEEYHDGGPGRYTHERCGPPPFQPTRSRRGGKRSRQIPLCEARATGVGPTSGG